MLFLFLFLVGPESGVGRAVLFIIALSSCRSPRLDKIGNSVRAVEVSKELVKHFSFHNFEVFSGLSAKKIDPTKRKNEAEHAAFADVLFAASNGDMSALASHYYAGVDLYAGDYDAR